LINHVQLREVRPEVLEAFFEHQRQPATNRMAAFPARDRETFMAKWRTMFATNKTTRGSCDSMREEIELWTLADYTMAHTLAHI